MGHSSSKSQWSSTSPLSSPVIFVTTRMVGPNGSQISRRFSCSARSGSADGIDPQSVGGILARPPRCARREHPEGRITILWIRGTSIAGPTSHDDRRDGLRYPRRTDSVGSRSRTDGRSVDDENLEVFPSHGESQRSLQRTGHDDRVHPSSKPLGDPAWQVQY